MKLSILLALLLTGSGTAALSTTEYGELGASIVAAPAVAVDGVAEIAAGMYDNSAADVNTNTDAEVVASAEVSTDTEASIEAHANVAAQGSATTQSETTAASAATDTGVAVEGNANTIVDVNLLGGSF